MKSAAVRRAIIWGILGLALILSLIYAFQPQSIPVDLVSVERGPLMVTLDEEGQARVRNVYVVSAPVAGRARRIDANVGDLVVANQTVIVEIEPGDPILLDPRTEAQAVAAVRTAEANEALAQAEVSESRAELEFASTELARARQLSQMESIAQRALDDATRRFKMARAAVATTEARLQASVFEREQAKAQLLSPIDTQATHGACACVPVRAPVDGKILRIVHKSEGVVDAGTPMVEIGDPTNLEIEANFISSDAVQVVPGQRAIIEDWGGSKVLSGRVRSVEPIGFTKVSALGIEEQRVNVIIDLTSPSTNWRRLGHGYRVEVRIVLWEGTEVQKVPLTALFRNGAAWAVMVEVDGRARMRTVEVGRRTRLEAEVVVGIAAGERVVISPSDRVVDGVRVHQRG